MTVSMAKLPKQVQALPEEAQVLWVRTYNEDFGWRCQESHAEKAAWRAVYHDYEESEDGTWTRK